MLFHLILIRNDSFYYFETIEIKIYPILSDPNNSIFYIFNARITNFDLKEYFFNSLLPFLFIQKTKKYYNAMKSIESIFSANNFDNRRKRVNE